MGKRIAAVSMVGAVALGGLGVAALNPLVTAGAQPEPTTEAPAEGARGALARALDALVADGTITREQADAVAAATKQEAQQARQQRREQRASRHDELLAVVAEALGSTPDAVRSALRDATSIAEQAEAAGVERQAVDDAITALFASRIEAAVVDGRIDEDRAAAATERLDAVVDRILEADGRGNGRHEGHRFGPRGSGRAPGSGN
jgi:polyhydroxyalkanoate synthesis regulator phasin